jgi:glycosyltransferase involved in cell wall biosynthesis
MTSWLLVSGDIAPPGGMDRANYELAAALAARPRSRLHLVAHRVAPELASREGVTVSHVPRPLGSHLLGAPLLAREAERRARALRAPAVAISNGGNADTADANWVHYVHAAYVPDARGVRQAVQAPASHLYFRSRERRALGRSRIVICNSRRTAADVASRVGVDPGRLRVVYYGSDGTFAAVDASARAAARRALGWDPERPVATFIGALGDRRKGFDRLFEAWRLVSGDRAWDVDLAVVGSGAELDAWRRRAAAQGVAPRMRFLGYRLDVSRILSASDLLIHPARYEAYGLGVHEALCSGVPAIVSRSAGIAERYPEDLRDWLIQDVESSGEIAERLREWRRDPDAARARVRPFASVLGQRTWTDMAAEIIRWIES